MADSSKLEAVNRLLSEVGIGRVNSLGSTRPDVALAEATLDEEERFHQSQGWWYNQRWNVTYTANASNEIDIPTDVFKVDLSRQYTPSTGPNAQAAVVKVGARLYDLVNKTFTFTAGTTVTVDTVVRLTFDELPEAARQYVIARAARKYYAKIRGQETRNLAEAEAQARAAFLQEEADVAELSHFDNPVVNRIWRGRGELPRS